MPFVDWVNKNQAKDATRSVPIHLLKQEAVYGGTDGDAPDNLLIQGDNLLALKALIPVYAGRVKCIFIDPPYNTQSAFEHYDDKLEHSQWLSMMYPRLALLRQLLADDGSIWVTIDDNEGHYLKVLMDEVFGRKRFVATIAWESRYSRSSDTSLSLSHNFILVYASQPEKWKTIRNKLPRSRAQAGQYKNPDNDPRGPWRAIPWDAPEVRANLEYPITTPTGKVRKPPQGRHWSRTEAQWLQLVNEGLAYFGKSGDGVPSFKQFLEDAPDIVPNTWWAHEDAGHTDEAQKEGRALFGDDLFGTPKPERLMQRIIHIASSPGEIVLDSFLGSGTTAVVAHKMGRRFIGIEMGDHARTHCIPRLQKVIEGEQGGISEAVGWKGGGGFRFCTLGHAAFDADGHINSDVRFGTLSAFIWHYETVTPGAKTFNKPLLGKHNGTAYYLLFNGILGDKRPQGGVEVVERETLSELGDWDLLDTPVKLEGFAIHETVNSFEIDVNGVRVTYRHLDAPQLDFNQVSTTVSEQDLVRWLGNETRQPYVLPTQLQAYLVRMITHLTKERGFTLTALVRGRELLAQAIGAEIVRLRKLAMVKGFQERLFDMAVPPATHAAQFSFQFLPGRYPARNCYRGSYEFAKHFYPLIHDLREKTASGQRSEEFVCAQAIDSHPKVKQWVRNIERQEKFSFWLPTSTDYFYPDFVAELTDGRVLVVEYKGEPYKTNDDSREKMQVGDQWEKSSDRRCLFLFAVADDQGRDVRKQLADKIG